MAVPNTRKMPAELVVALKQQQAKLQARIARIENREKVQSRKDATRCKIIIGGAMLADATRHPDTAHCLKTVSTRAVLSERDRALLAARLKSRLS